jgi:hypothetical protein
MVQYPCPYGFTRLYASRSEDLTVTSLTQTYLNTAHTSTPGSIQPMLPYTAHWTSQSHSHIVLSCTQKDFLFYSNPVIFGSNFPDLN